ncbi:MAG: 50S ribosomal protein L5 [Planctomycetes bacterium]|nr:50S ribosomal protein L5 [Planctomycetota bacterium]
MATSTANPSAPAARPRLADKYRNEVAPAVAKQFGIQNKMAIPRVTKIVVSMGVGKSIENRARIDHAARDLGAITGQKPVITKARNSISGFRLREGMPIGLAVTLRRERMYEFLDRIISVVIPRIRDFRGLPRKLDGRGNYSFGLSEQSVFPEIPLDKVEFVQGMNITICTSAGEDGPAEALLERMGMPFRR